MNWRNWQAGDVITYGFLGGTLAVMVLIAATYLGWWFIPAALLLSLAMWLASHYEDRHMGDLFPKREDKTDDQ